MKDFTCFFQYTAYPELKIVLIVPDLPEFMHEAERGIKGLVRKYWNHRILSHYSEIDGFVLLTEHMAERLFLS